MERADEIDELFDHPLTDADVIAIVSHDLPQMTVAQLAELLTNIFLDGPSPVGDALAPLARQELARRRFIEMAESIARAA
ncbi:MAG: hypothetical protein ACRD1H_15030 [Vicinamibacterales bacterium]